MVVDFRATFDEEVSDEQAASVLKNAIKDGKLGTFKVDSTSVSPIAPQPKSKEPTKGKCQSTRIERNTVVRYFRQMDYFSPKSNAPQEIPDPTSDPTENSGRSSYKEMFFLSYLSFNSAAASSYKFPVRSHPHRAHID